MDEMIKPLQATGLWGPRNIWKKVLEIPIPKYDPKNKIHNKLAEIAHNCETKLQTMQEKLSKQQNVGKARSVIRDSFNNQISEITKLTVELLSRENKKNQD